MGGGGGVGKGGGAKKLTFWIYTEYHKEVQGYLLYVLLKKITTWRARLGTRGLAAFDLL